MSPDNPQIALFCRKTCDDIVPASTAHNDHNMYDVRKYDNT